MGGESGCQVVCAASGQSDGGRDRAFALISFALVVGPRMRVAADRGQCGHVHHPAQSTTVALRGVHSSGPFSESQETGASPAQAASWSAEPIKAADSGLKFGAEPNPMPGMLVITSASGWRRNRSPRRLSRRYAPRHRPGPGTAAKNVFAEWLADAGSAPAARPNHGPVSGGRLAPTPDTPPPIAGAAG